MNKAEKKFTLYAVLSVFVLLAVLLGVINVIGFTMAAQYADEVTHMVASGSGRLMKQTERTESFEPAERPGQMGPMGPNSPELRATMRYFTFSFSENGKSKLVAFNISAVDESEAQKWAASLISGGKTGWTRGTYRYRVYEQEGRTFVTVLDQGRELLPAYRILIFSIVGTAVGVALSWLVLRMVGKRLFAPLEEADRKQKKFISNAEKEFKLPLTVISASAELIERESGPSEQTRSINRQVRKMDALVRGLGSLTIFDDEKMTRTPFSLSELLTECLDRSAERFASRGIELFSDVEEGVTLTGEPEAMRQVVSELIENALKYSRGKASFSLKREDARIKLTASNGTELPTGPVDQVFDRFTVLSNASDGSAGLGLAYVRDIVRAHNGRVGARVIDGSFVLQLDL